MLNKFSHIIVVVVFAVVVPHPPLPIADLAVYPSLPHVAAVPVVVVVVVRALLPASLPLPLPVAVAIASHRFALGFGLDWLVLVSFR